MMVAEADMVPGDDGWISDESSFYGDDPTDSLTLTPPSTYWRTIHSSLPSVLALSATATAKGKSKARLHYPHDGDPATLQSTETPAAFLAHLPPSTTTFAAAGPWLWVHNPHIDDEASPHRDLAAFEERGRELVETFRATKPKTTLAAKRRALEKGIREAAAKAGVTSGKWMLFPGEDHVDETWRVVCEGVVEGRLGMTAKVATAGENRGTGRLICVYTKDFGDVKDVRRVLDAMVSMELVNDGDGGRGIYYKADAYTHLGIESGNDFGLKASMYGSKEMLSKRG